MSDLLFVCTGNICRSPAAELLARRVLGASGLTVASAGVDAPDGVGMDPGTAAMVRRTGADPEPHRSRRLTAEMLDAAVLVVALDRGHRSAIATTSPRVTRRTFTLRELARLSAGLDDDELTAIAEDTELDARGRLAALAREYGFARGAVDRPVRGDADDVADPFGGPVAAHERAVAAIEESLAVVAAAAERTGLRLDRRRDPAPEPAPVRRRDPAPEPVRRRDPAPEPAPAR